MTIREARDPIASTLLLALIQRSAWKGYSQKFVLTEF
jgi:hypothetical protein